MRGTRGFIDFRIAYTPTRAYPNNNNNNIEYNNNNNKKIITQSWDEYI